MFCGGVSGITITPTLLGTTRPKGGVGVAPVCPPAVIEWDTSIGKAMVRPTEVLDNFWVELGIRVSSRSPIVGRTEACDLVASP